MLSVEQSVTRDDFKTCSSHTCFFQISAVRAVVPNKSNNEIVLVLQHFENSVDKAVQAFLEGMRTSVFELKNGK